MPPIPLLINPAAGGGTGRRLAARLRSIPDIEIRPTGGPEDVVAQAAEAARAGHDRVLVAGGDGTLHHAIRALAGTPCALGIVPAGSGNDLARSLGLPLGDPAAAARRALGATPRRIDLGRAAGVPFACTAGVGFDGAVARFVRERAGRLPRSIVYPWAVARTLLGFAPPHVIVRAEGFSFDGRVTLALLANAPYFGRGMWIAPGASLEDGWLDLVLIESLPRRRLLSAFPRVYRGTHLGHPAVRTARVREAELSVNGPTTVHGDGEALVETGAEPTRIAVWPQALGIV